MKQLEKERTTSLAWFKLAEVVARGEKERALNMYRLLAHSIANTALKFQLEGDLLFIFHDEQAFQCYQKAAQLYKKNSEFGQVVMLYDILVSHAPAVHEYRRELIAAYEQIGNEHKVKNIIVRLVEECCIQKEYSNAVDLIKESQVPKENKGALYMHVISAATKNIQNHDDKRLCKEYIGYLAEMDPFLYITSSNINQFLTSLRLMDDDIYHYACQALTK